MVLCLVLIGVLIALNLLGAALAVLDKGRAVRNRGGRQRIQRVPEKTFHTITLLGGGPGTALAFALVRHKTRKALFALRMVLAFAASLVIWWFLLTRTVCL